MAQIFYIVLTPISTTYVLLSIGNTRKYQQIEVYIYQCADCLIWDILNAYTFPAWVI